MVDGGTSIKPQCQLITGVAGTGKTTLIQSRIADDPDYALLTATTGISAVNLGGAVTLNSALRYFDEDSLRDSYLRGTLGTRMRELRRSGVRNLLIEEMSMLTAPTLDLLYRAACDTASAAKDGKPLGLILVGDFCLALGTRVMMADGTLRKVEHVDIGDSVMGPDSKPRKVIRRFAGFAQMYRITQTNGDSYTVTENHTVALKRSVDGQRREWHGQRYPKLGDFHLVKAGNLAVESKKFLSCFVGYKAGTIQFPSKEVTIDPYFLGLWLGDGDSNDPRITTNDEEIAQYCKFYAESLGLGIAVTGWPHRTDARRIAITHGRVAGNKPNILWNRFRRYHLPLNKHIPLDYLTNDESVRLQLLAGIIDTDGCWHGNRYIVTFASERLARDLKQLVDQLGFRGTIRKLSNGAYKDNPRKGWTVSIGGDTWRIPCRVARKKSFPRRLGRSRLTSVLRVTSVGLGDYAGFEVDGDNMFLLADGTVTHNCQLPPVKGRWAFEADCWDYFAAGTERLTKVWRQDQQHFLDALNLARQGRGGEAAEVLEANGARWETALQLEYDGTTVVPKNDQVDRYNAEALSRLPGKILRVRSRRWGQLRSEWKNIPEELEVKLGAYVMVLSNAPDMSYVNGDCGYIVDFDRDEAGNERFGVELVRTGQTVYLSRIVRNVEQKERPESGTRDLSGDASKYQNSGGAWHGTYHTASGKVSRRAWVLGQVEYFPLRLAYATTVHKSQGLSLDRVQLDYRNRFFGAPAMMYTALSRCRTLEGLRLVGQREVFAKNCQVDSRVVAWL